MPAARRRPASRELRPRPGVYGAGSEVWVGSLFQDRVVQRQIGHQLFEPGVLPLQLLEPLGLVRPKAAVLFAPAVVRLVDSVLDAKGARILMELTEFVTTPRLRLQLATVLCPQTP